MIFSFLLQLMLLTGLNSDQKTTENLKWHDFNEGIELAQKQKKYILVDFYTDWCGWCKKMDKDTYTNPTVMQILKKNFILIKVNAEDAAKSAKYKQYNVTYPELSQGFGVTGFPATVFLNAQADYVTLVPGYLPADEMTTILKFIHTTAFEKMTYPDFKKSLTSN
ncbi:MAG: thioredoxin fold domain-containing protein [Bacteroidetes bacterium]|nr:thioredoxin fold domain-containing protein [Bacteroidota bacterium]